MYIAWFQTSANFDIYWQYPIGFCGINHIILTDIKADIDNMADIDARNCKY